MMLAKKVARRACVRGIAGDVDLDLVVGPVMEVDDDQIGSWKDLCFARR